MKITFHGEICDIYLNTKENKLCRNKNGINQFYHNKTAPKHYCTVQLGTDFERI